MQHNADATRVLEFYGEIPFLNPLFNNFASTFLPQKKNPTTPETLGLPGVGTLFVFVCIVFWLSWGWGPWENIWEHTVK